MILIHGDVGCVSKTISQDLIQTLQTVLKLLLQ